MKHTPRPRLLRSLLLLSLIPVLVTPPALSQDAPAPSDVFVDTLDVRLVEVEVVVTDRGGRRVPGLGAEDFALIVDGEEAEITHFSEVRDRSVAAREGAPAVTDEPEAAPRNLLVFIDDYFTDSRYRRVLFKRLLADLETMSPRDSMAVVRFAGREVEVLSPWSDSREHLSQVFEQARELKSGEQVRRAQFLGTTGSDPRDSARLNRIQVEKVTAAVAVTLGGYAEAPGRKILMLVSSGWPADYGDVVGIDGGLGITQESLRALEAVDRVADVANLLGYTIYPVHLGLAETAESARLAPRNLDSLAPDVSDPAAAREGLDRSSRGALGILADETGGTLMAYGIAKPVLPLEWVDEDTRSYYVLGFSPEMARDGVRHDVEVQVAGEGLRVRHRAGYLDLSPQQKATMATESVLLLGSGGEPLEASLGEPERARRGVARVPLRLRIPMDRVTMIPRRGVYHSNVELRVVAVDARGDRSEVPVEKVSLYGPKPPPGSHATYAVGLELRRKSQKLVVSLLDVPTGVMLSTTLEFEP